MQETWQEHIIWTKTTITVWCSGHVRAWLLGGGCEELLGEWTEWSLSALEPLGKTAATEALTCISAPRASSWLTSCELAGRGEIDGWDAWFCVTLAVVTSALLATPKPLTVWITTNWKILKEMGISDHLTCLMRNLYTGQEATVRTRHGTTDWFQIGKEVCQGYILSPCLFNLYAEYVMQNAGLDEAQARIKIARRNISNLRYADDTTLMAES